MLGHYMRNVDSRDWTLDTTYVHHPCFKPSLKAMNNSMVIPYARVKRLMEKLCLGHLPGRDNPSCRGGTDATLVIITQGGVVCPAQRCKFHLVHRYQHRVGVGRRLAPKPKKLTCPKEVNSSAGEILLLTHKGSCNWHQV